METKSNRRTKVNGSYQKFAESLHDIVAEAVTEAVTPISSEIEIVKTRLSEHHLGILNLTDAVTKIGKQVK